ncbi:AAA family ATPase [Chitinispirillales bacterium ANBcel5]|uniref:AAA family ATPase n=1 Tax=Cellulosispirillum alkaliphilum TaxID=3039283 RepID=UPI002A4FFB45|nr:AAA family ATPase [Chitinispirillales bacterium ANBcel5]
MKILELRFKNLNSLYGEWIIDFTDPEYVSNGIFALTGPTGAGKSTILDALCLALYGATPRLGKITKSANEIMSRQTGECYAEVLFESQAGRYRCHWEQRRARKKTDGKLQDQEHQIANGDTGKLIETKKSLVGAVIEEKTGMDFDRFTRSILLAQGGFDTFLKADVEQKSRILEQITGTEIYSEISRRVHERQRDEREKLSLLQAETKGIVILEPEFEKELQKELEQKQKEEQDLTNKANRAAQAITCLKSVEELKKELVGLSDEWSRLQGDIEAFKPQRERLARAQKAASLDGMYASVTGLRNQLAYDQQSLKKEKEALPDLEKAVSSFAERLLSAEKHIVKAKEELKTAAPVIQKVRSLDQLLWQQKTAIKECEDGCKKDAQKIHRDKQERKTLLGKLTTAKRSLENTDRYLSEHSHDEWLVSGLAGVEEQLGALLSRQKEIEQKETEQKKAFGVLDEATKKSEESKELCKVRSRELNDIVKRLQHKKETLSELLAGRLLREYRTEKDTLLREMAFLAKISELEDHRSRLEDGKPCPLCGAHEHPFAQGNVPVPDETEKRVESLNGIIQQAENQEVAIRKLEEEHALALKLLTECEKREAAAEHEKGIAGKAVSELRESLERKRSELAALKVAASERLKPLGITEISDVSSLLLSLKKRLDGWLSHANRKSDIEKLIATSESDLRRLDAVIETQDDVLDEKYKKLEALKKEFAAGVEERKALFGEKRPNYEEQCLNRAISDAEEEEKKVRVAKEEVQRKFNAAQTLVESLKGTIVIRNGELKNSESQLHAALEGLGFSDEKEFLEARLSTDQQQTISLKAKQMDDRQTEIRAKQMDRETRLATENKRVTTATPLEELELQHKEYELSLKQMRETIAGINHRLRENVAAKKRIEEKQSLIEAQKGECRRWEKLHGLIGSSDGKKFRNFAQGLTFELMVSHANRQLQNMTDRYLLIRDDQEPLELNVIDNYQAGEIRSTKNLSGGESFIVSLTLALGLSRMASRKVRVDSLFLDEGFGTLDEEALETALETLSGLQQDGKLIGIISHVSALKEQISTQISVTPVSGGHSVLGGPGCARYNSRDKNQNENEDIGRATEKESTLAV